MLTFIRLLAAFVAALILLGGLVALAAGQPEPRVNGGTTPRVEEGPREVRVRGANDQPAPA